MQLCFFFIKEKKKQEVKNGNSYQMGSNCIFLLGYSYGIFMVNDWEMPLRINGSWGSLSGRKYYCSYRQKCHHGECHGMSLSWTPRESCHGSWPSNVAIQGRWKCHSLLLLFWICTMKIWAFLSLASTKRKLSFFADGIVWVYLSAHRDFLYVFLYNLWYFYWVY